ncbi:MAG: hypothetical protein FRX49_04605 [Trebouxia sp. A1-2]|nr:MAG: hypothetical protein FRX49_04605 [Trebouxia sp. A1-2]
MTYLGAFLEPSLGRVAVGYCQLPSDSATVLNMPKSEQTREGRSLGREATVPGIVVDAKPVTARLAHGVFPMQGGSQWWNTPSCKYFMTVSFPHTLFPALHAALHQQANQDSINGTAQGLRGTKVGLSQILLAYHGWHTISSGDHRRNWGKGHNMTAEMQRAGKGSDPEVHELARWVVSSNVGTHGMHPGLIEVKHLMVSFDGLLVYLPLRRHDSAPFNGKPKHIGSCKECDVTFKISVGCQ